MSEYIAKASIEPRDYRVVFLIQIKDIPIGISSHFLFNPCALLRTTPTDVTCTVNSAQAPSRHTKAPT